MNLNTVLIVISIIAGIVGLITTIFLVGKFVGTLTEAINSAVAIFEVRVTGVTEDMRDLKDSNEKLTNALNELTTVQLVEVKENVARLDESTKSAHLRINKVECIIDRRRGYENENNG